MYLTRFQSAWPNNLEAEKLHQSLIRLALNQNQLPAAIDELQRFRGTYPESIYRDDLIFELGVAYFRNQQYERSLISFEQIAEEYGGTLLADSSAQFIDFINTYYQQSQKSGVSEMAGLMARMLTGTERRQLLFDLGKVYLKNLKEYGQAAQIFDEYIKTAQDSSELGTGHYYLATEPLEAGTFRPVYRKREYRQCFSGKSVSR